MEKLEDIVKQRLNTHSLGSSAKSAEILHTTNKLLSDLLKDKEHAVKAYRFDGGILFIAAESASWSQEAWGAQESILNSLQKQFGKKVVKKIRIKNLTIN